MSDEFDIEKKIRDLMHEKKVMLKDIHEAAGLTRAGLLRMMQKNTYTLDALKKMASCLKTSVSDLIGEGVSTKVYLDAEVAKVNEIRLKDLQKIIDYQDKYILELEKYRDAAKTQSVAKP